MALNSFQSNQGTQTNLLTDNTGGTVVGIGTSIPVMKLDVSPQGTAGTIWQGFAPDITNAGTLTGTQNLPMNANGLTTISAQLINTFTGTVLAEASLDGATWNPTTMVVLNSGSIVSSLNGPALVQINAAGLGSVRLRANTISSGSAVIFLRGNYVGAANVMMDNPLPVGPNIIGNIGTLITGTLTSITNLANGTVKSDARTPQDILTFGTQVSGTAAVVATLVGSASVGAGTHLWLNDLSVNNPNANVGVIIGFGTAQQGTNVLLRGTFGTSGAVGIEKAYPKAVDASMTDQDLVVSLTAAGTVDINVSYFISA